MEQTITSIANDEYISFGAARKKLLGNNKTGGMSFAGAASKPEIKNPATKNQKETVDEERTKISNEVRVESLITLHDEPLRTKGFWELPSTSHSAPNQNQLKTTISDFTISNRYEALLTLNENDHENNTIQTSNEESLLKTTSKETSNLNDKTTDHEPMEENIASTSLSEEKTERRKRNLEARTSPQAKKVYVKEDETKSKDEAGSEKEQFESTHNNLTTLSIPQLKPESSYNPSQQDITIDVHGFSANGIQSNVPLLQLESPKNILTTEKSQTNNEAINQEHLIQVTSQEKTQIKEPDSMFPKNSQLEAESLENNSPNEHFTPNNEINVNEISPSPVIGKRGKLHQEPKASQIATRKMSPSPILGKTNKFQHLNQSSRSKLTHDLSCGCNDCFHFQLKSMKQVSAKTISNLVDNFIKYKAKNKYGKLEDHIEDCKCVDHLVIKQTSKSQIIKRLIDDSKGNKKTHGTISKIPVFKPKQNQPLGTQPPSTTKISRNNVMTSSVSSSSH